MLYVVMKTYNIVSATPNTDEIPLFTIYRRNNFLVDITHIILLAYSLIIFAHFFSAPS